MLRTSNQTTILTALMAQVHHTKSSAVPAAAGWATTTSRSAATLRRSPFRARLLWTAAAAAASTTFSSQQLSAASAFVLQPRHRARDATFTAPPASQHRNTIRILSPQESPSHYYSQQRSLFTNRKARRSDSDPDSEGGGGFLQKIGQAAKSLLPASWFQSDEEKRRALQRRQVQDEISGGLSELLRDAPLPVRAMGKLIQPLVSSAMSGLAETLAEQKDAVDAVLRAARNCLDSDPAVERALGTPLIVSPPFSQSSSTSTINGRTSRRMELVFNVQGSTMSAVARVSATSGGSNAPPTIEQLQLQTSNGRVLNVATTYTGRKRSSSRSIVNGDDGGDDTIIEAEIIEKKSKL